MLLADAMLAHGSCTNASSFQVTHVALQKEERDRINEAFSIDYLPHRVFIDSVIACPGVLRLIV